MQIVNYNSGIWVITVDGLMLGRTMGDYTNLFAVTSFRYKNIEGGYTQSRCVTSYDFAGIIMDATWYNRVDIHMENLRSAPKFAQHYPEPSPAVYSCTWAEIESIIDFIVTNLY